MSAQTNARRMTWRSAQDRAECIDLSVPMEGKEKSSRIDLGLALLSRIALPNVCYTRNEIAAFCGCTDTAIYAIEKRAMDKLRVKLKEFREAL